MEDNVYDVEFLGQKIRYPSTVSSAATAILVSLILCVTVYLSLRVITHKDHAEQAGNIIRFVSGDVRTDSSKEFQPSSAFQYSFWTPSEETASFLLKVSERRRYTGKRQMAEHRCCPS